MTATVKASVAGSWINGAAVVTGGPTHQVINPATGGVVTELALATPADVDTAVAAARTAQRDWGSATPVDRAAVLAKLAAGSPVTAEGILAEGTVLGAANPCWVVNQITGGEWSRVDPAEAGQFTCDDNVTVTVSGDFK